MGLFNRKKEQERPPPPSIVADLPKAGDPVKSSLSAHSRFIKRATCTRCGSPKTLPSATAYLYCDFCGSLIDYDFRIANADTNAGVTNTVFHRLVAQVQPQLDHALATRDETAFRQLYRDIFRQWIGLCPQALSPRAKTDGEFRERMIAYCAECVVSKDLDPSQAAQNAQMVAMGNGLQRIPQGDGAWLVAGPFWQYAELFKKQMEEVYAKFDATGVSAMDPDEPPPGVALRLEYSTFCQGFLPHLTPPDGEKLLAMFGLTGDYTEAKPVDTESHNCGGCGAALTTVVGARLVVCESCGRRVDVASGSIPCHNCGAQLDFPEGESHLACPYCQTQNQRV